MKKILLGAAVLMSAPLLAQDSTGTVTVSGYAEAYYQYDFNKPADNNRPGFIYSHNRHNEFNLNLGFVKANYTAARVRANLALAAGTYMNANYAAEPGVLKNIYEANVGIRISKNKSLWIDAGIMPSHIGFESAVSKDCWTLTRGMLADNSPYFETGAKITYTSDNGKWLVSGMALNGWQRIKRVDANSLMSWGTQVQFKPSSSVLLNYSTFIGTDKPDSARLSRLFHNIYGIINVTDKFGITAGFDIGTEEKTKGSDDKNTWWTPVLILKYAFNGKWAIAGRVEHYNDENGVIIATGSPNGFQTTGYSLNIDHSPFKNILVRAELRSFNSKDDIFTRSSGFTNNNTFFNYLNCRFILMPDQEANKWLEKIRQSQKGKLKIYIGMSAGVGKSYRMLQEAHNLLRNGVHIKIGYIETHGRKETEALVEGLPVIPRRVVFYKGKELNELDVQAILLLQPEVVLVDELAHTNIPGSKNEKRWQDVIDILDAGIDVITAVNIQHIESINEDVKDITGVEVTERVPDKLLQMADEVVNIDLTADELITRLKEGKIYDHSKVQQALQNFFRPEKILQLRELALKEVAGQVERKVDYEVTAMERPFRHEHFLACISTNHEIAQRIIRKTGRLASYYNSRWYVLYVQTPGESTEKIPLASQRHLINNFKTATELGAEVLQVKQRNIAKAVIATVVEKKITTVCIGKPHLNLFQVILRTNVFNQLLKTLSANDVDLIILS